MSRLTLLGHRGVSTVLITAALWDTSIGEGVATDSNGQPRTNLPVDTAGSANVYYLGNGGSDSNTGLSHAQRFATAAYAATFLRDNYGDMILCAEGSTFSERLPTVRFRTGGKSLRYPWVVQSYDPADPTNQAKWGTATDATAPIFTGDTGGNPWGGAGGTLRYVALRGVKLAGIPTSDQGIGLGPVGDGFLFENLFMPHAGIGMGGFHPVSDGGPFQEHWIVRGCTLYNTYSLIGPTSGSLLYFDGCNSITVEGNKLLEAGMRSFAERENTIDNGGGSAYRHPIYQQDGSGMTCRYNFIARSCADAGSHRGPTNRYLNFSADCPGGIGMGDGTGYATNPLTRNGIPMSLRYDVMLGSPSQTLEFGGAGYGISAAGSTLGSGAYDNVLSGSPRANFLFNPKSKIYPGSGETTADAIFTYFNFIDNVGYHWLPGLTMTSDYPAYNPTDITTKIVSTYTGNAWDAPTNGTNINVGSLTFPNPIESKDVLAAALGYADMSAMVAYAKTHPLDQSIVTSGLSIMLTGFGKSVDQVPPVITVSASAGAAGVANVTVNVSKCRCHSPLHIVAVPQGSAAPNEQQIRGRRGGDWDPVPNAAWKLYRKTVVGNNVVTLSGLSAGNYTIYAVFDHTGTLSNVASGNVTIS